MFPNFKIDWFPDLEKSCKLIKSYNYVGILYILWIYIFLGMLSSKILYQMEIVSKKIFVKVVILPKTHEHGPSSMTQVVSLTTTLKCLLI